MKRSLLIAAILFILALILGHHNATAATYPGATREPALEAKLPTAVKVYSTQNTNLSFAMLGDREIYLDLNVTAALKGDPSQDSFGLALHTFLHEYWHIAFQETDEYQTDCGAFAITRYMLRHFWGYTNSQAQTLYMQSFGYAHYGAPPQSLRTTVDPTILKEVEA